VSDEQENQFEDLMRDEELKVLVPEAKDMGRARRIDDAARPLHSVPEKHVPARSDDGGIEDRPRRFARPPTSRAGNVLRLGAEVETIHNQPNASTSTTIAVRSTP
jgi:hypothetical protein